MSITKPKRFSLINVGKRFKPNLPKDAIIVRITHSKASRRMLRRQAMKSMRHIERSILDAQRLHAEATHQTPNGHAARRLLEAERRHRSSLPDTGRGTPATGG